MSNRLAAAQSLYLRKHAENPIDWWSWGDEAIATARQDNKPIFLSIGYSSCHWCTVMEGEAFSDQAIADYMNAYFLPIKVDREERPDIDSIYMQALQMMTGQGGWPLNIFLTPDDLLPFYGGTYFPVDPRYGRPGFLDVLQHLRRIYDDEQGKVQAVKTEILGRLQQGTAIQSPELLDRELLTLGLQSSAGILSADGRGTRFPMIPYAEVALRGSRFQFADARYDARQGCRQRGLDLALGGIFDHVAGGFHRYTVDPTWTVPHFEKMLYDNGQIVEYLANLWSAGVQEPAFERAIALTVSWLSREMTAPEGYFYAAQDADSFETPLAVEPEEGAFYVWRYGELAQCLSEAELAELVAQFTVTPAGNFEAKTVLQRRSPGVLSKPLEVSLAKLFALRYGSSPDSTACFPPARNNQEAKTHPWPGRIPAVTDTKMIVAWNSLMISGLARAAAVFQQPAYLNLAAQAAEFILGHQMVGVGLPAQSVDRLHRLNYNGAPSVIAQSEDYALLIKALLDLDQATQGIGASQTTSQASDWLAHAVSLQAEFHTHLWSLELGGYYNTDASDDLVVRERSIDDNATPAANGIAIANLVRLALRTENLDYLDHAEQALRSFSGAMKRTPQACPSLFAALDWFQTQTLVKTTGDRLIHLQQQYFPTAVYALADALPDAAVGLVCQGLSCQEPACHDQQLLMQLQASQTRG